MKKILSFIACVAVATAMQAATYTEAALITMTCTGGDEMQEMELYVNPNLQSPATVQNLATTYEVGQLNMYASYNNGKYSSFAANAISNLPVVIVTNRRDVEYTLSFNVPISTEGLVLTDLRSNEGIKNINIVNNESYTFSIEDEDGYNADNKTNLTIADRFVINYVAPAPVDAYEVTLNAYGLATFSAGEVVTLPAGLKAYTAEYVSKSDYLTLHEISGAIPANTGIILYGEANASYQLAKEGTPSTLDANNLQPASAWTAAHEGYDIFVLSGNVLVEYTGTEMKDNKAYLKLTAGIAAPRRMRLVFDQATGIDNVDATVKGVKFIENGQIFIRRGENIYNAQGQIVK